MHATPSHPVPLCPNPDLEGPARGVREGCRLVQRSAPAERAAGVAARSPQTLRHVRPALPLVGCRVLRRPYLRQGLVLGLSGHRVVPRGGLRPPMVQFHFIPDEGTLSVLDTSYFLQT